jgi:sugar (pentulose or hexulose) kinase
LGAVAAGIAPSTAESTWPLPGDTRVMDPIPAQAALYAERSAIYRELYGRLPKA